MALALAGCTSSPVEDPPAAVAFAAAAADGAVADTLPTSVPATTMSSTSTTSTTRPVPSPGTPERPFTPLPEVGATVIVTDGGIPVTLKRSTAEGWLVETPCSGEAMVATGTYLGAAHVVLDPGHGGVEYGTATPEGVLDPRLLEKDVSLHVALRAQALLEEAGATVVLTRTGDYTMTIGARARLAAALRPGLFVSVHHNGGAPVGGDRPGTIVFTKSGDERSSRFGGLFYTHLTAVLDEAAAAKRADYDEYRAALGAHEAAVSAYDQSVLARDAALVANGQIDPASTTSTPPAPAAVGGEPVPPTRMPATTTTVPPVVEPTVPVPESLPPPSFDVEPVRRFQWSGQGNAGVRAWTDDGLDYLGVLRHSEDLPAALVEFVYMTNPSEAELLADPAFVEAQAQALADAIVAYFADPATSGHGHIADQVGSQPIGGGGRPDDCTNPDLSALQAVPTPEAGSPVGG